MFTPILNPDGNVNTSALLEQLTMIGAIYWNRQDEAGRMLALVGGGQILGWQFQDHVWPPSFALTRQGNDLFLSMAGTTNANQWARHLVGVFGAAYPGFTCDAHGFFLSAAADVFIALQPILPIDHALCNFHFAGHSYGGAVASLLAMQRARDFPLRESSYLGFSSPKTLTLGYTGALPTKQALVAPTGDVIPSLPPNSLISTVQPSLGIWAYSIPVGWRHYASGSRFNSLGQINPVDLGNFEQFPTAGAIGTTVFVHGIGAQMSAIENLWTATNGQGNLQTAVEISARIRSRPEAQDQNVNIPIRPFINVTRTNTRLFVSGPAAPVTEGNALTLNHFAGRIRLSGANDPILSPLNAGEGGFPMTVKITHLWHNNFGGFSESFYKPGTAPGDVRAESILSYVRARIDVSGKQTEYDFTRVSQVDGARQVRIFTPDAISTRGAEFSGTYNSDSDFSDTSLLLIKQGNNGTGRTFLRGIPDSVVKQGGQYRPDGIFNEKMLAYSNRVNQLEYYFKLNDSGAQLRFPLTAATQNNDGTATLTAGGAIFATIAVGAHRVIRISGQKQPRYINGSVTVIVTSNTTCVTLKTLPLVGFVAGTGVLIYSPQFYTRILRMNVSKVSERKAGRPSGAFRGRSSVRVKV